MKPILQSILLSSLLVTSSMAKDTNSTKETNNTKKEVKKEASTTITSSDIQIFTSDNSDGKVTTKSIQKAFEKAGFFVSANRDMNTPFKKQFKETSFDTYNLFFSSRQFSNP